MCKGVRQGRRAGLLALAAALLWSSAGCGPTCADIARRRSLLLASRRPAKQPGWHLAVELPLDSLNGFIAGRLAEIPSVRVPLHLPGGLERLLEPLTLRVTHLALTPAPEDRLAASAEVKLLYGDEEALSTTVEAEVRPQVNAERRTLEVGLGPESLKRLRPHLGPRASERLAEVIYRRLPALAQALTTREIIRDLAQATIVSLGDGLYRLLGRRVLGKLGELTRLRLELPPFPLKRIALRSTSTPAARLTVVGELALPVAQGLRSTAGAGPSSQPVTPSAASSGAARAQLLLAPQAAVELVNWSIDQGLLPQYYDRHGDPRKEPGYELLLGWEPGQRPLKLHLSGACDGPCLYVRFAGVPALGAKGKRLELDLRDGLIEEIAGPPLVRAAMWLRRFGSSAFSLSKKLAAQAHFTVAGRSLSFEIESAELVGERFRFDLRLAVQ